MVTQVTELELVAIKKEFELSSKYSLFPNWLPMITNILTNLGMTAGRGYFENGYD